MKAFATLIFFAALSLFTSPPSAAQETTDAESVPSGPDDPEPAVQERMQRVAEEIKRRRQIRQAMARSSGDEPELSKPPANREQVLHGVVYSPPAVVDPDEDFPMIAIVDAPLGYAAEMYALLSQREVMVSVRVAGLPITVHADGLTRTEACAAFEAVLTEAGVTIQPLDEETVALLETKTANKIDNRDKPTRF